MSDAKILAAVESESGRDISTDGAKLDGIQSGAVAAGATGDAFAASHGADTSNPHAVTAGQVTETATAKIMTAAERTKLSGVEAGATADQTGAEIKAAYEAEADTNAFTDADQAKLADAKQAAVLTQTDYDALTPDANTLYFITA
jgi:hypothetical protein